MLLKYRLLLTVLALFPVLLFAQRQQSLRQDSKNSIVLSWGEVHTINFTDTDARSYLWFEGATYPDADSPIPVYQYRKRLATNPARLQATLLNATYETVPQAQAALLAGKIVAQAPEVTSRVSVWRKKPFAYVDVVPFRKNPSTGAIERLVRFELDIVPEGRAEQAALRASWANTSVLASGTWYRIGVAEHGVYKLTPQFFRDMGLEPATINPQHIRIYGNGGKMLPFDNNVPRPDDLLENAIYVEGEADGSFDNEDYVLFYGQGPDHWERNGSDFTHVNHWYSDSSYYFITVDLGAGKRVQPVASEAAPADVVVTTFDDYQFHENEWTNLIKTGRHWYGEYFNSANEYDFVFGFPDIDATAPGTVRARLAARGLDELPTYTVSVAGSSETSTPISAVSTCYTCTYAFERDVTTTFTPNGSNVSVNVTYNKNNVASVAWLDYLEVQVRRQLKVSDAMLSFRDANSLSSGVAEYHVQYAGENLRVWDVTDASNAGEQQFEPDTYHFRASTDALREYIAFTGESFLTPRYHGRVANQNLHALDGVQLVIVANPKFYAQAEQLAEFHRNEVPENERLEVALVTTTQVYNEFSSGSQDITAIKDLMRMLYEEAGTDSLRLPRYLMLVGDGSYDMKDRVNGNTNFVPTYQSNNSWKPTDSYTSDDYFGLLDPNERDRTGDIVDLGIGRLPVKTVAEAQSAVNKIRHYYDSRSFGAWRNWLVFTGDDEDGNIHMRDANRLATRVDTTYPVYNIEKIYFDAYPQVSTSGGQRYPDVNDALDSRMDKGALVLSYVGHGGELGWAHERVLEVPQVNKWTNYDRMPLFVTATCEFSRYDDPQRTSAGELVFLNPSGGGIGLLTTTRLVYSTPNYELARQFFANAFEPMNAEGKMPTLGDLVVRTKINGPLTVNSRNFTLLGDPALTLAYPEYGAVTTAMPDTIRALSKVTVRGYVVDAEGAKKEDFNGTIYPVVFDKSRTVQTLGNDGGSKFNFSLRNSILFKGKASVTNGDFEFTFVVPRDINYTLGEGKISYYFEDGAEDGHGYTTDFVIGGSDSNVANDTQGPEAELYMNDESFVFGGLTDESPDLLAFVFDENGINTVGNGIGHDIVAVLDENTSQAVVLNDFYESDLDSYQSGSIRYPFSELEDGPHTLSLKVWDVYNNSTDAYTEFVVASDAELALSHVLNYPNPFTTNTAFYFEHNRPGQQLDVKIQIFTVAGKLVKTIDTYAASDGYRVGPIEWDGLDDFNDKIGKGVYLYKVRVLAPDGKSADEFEKLVILN